METRVVAPETGVRIDRDDGRDDLGDEEEKDGDIKGGAGDLKFFVEYGFYCPDGGNENGY